MGIKNIFSKVFILICTMFFCVLSGFAFEVSSYNGLRAAVNTINNNPEGDTTIILNGNININSDADPLVLSTNTILTSALDTIYTIRGNNNTNPLFTFHGSSTTISNIKFSSSTANNSAVIIEVGAAETGQNYSTFTIDNVTFLKNTSHVSTGGGALNIVSEQGTSISNTTFSSNSALGTGANGGALYYQGEIGFIGESITAIYNEAAQNGGAMYVSSGTIQYSTFTGNIAAQDGGAIYASTITLTGSKFLNNTATNGSGGALYVTDYAKIQNTNFSNNIAAQDGGAIYNEGNETSLTGVTFNRNQANQGGAIYNAGLMNISNVSINNNTSALDGGGIYAAGTVNLKESSFNNNTASNGNGGAIYVDDGVSLTIIGNSNFNNNTANGTDKRGGAIYVNNGSLTLRPTGGTITFQGNTDSSGSNDIYLAGSSSVLNINTVGTVNFYGGIQGEAGSSISANTANINWYAAEGFNGDFSMVLGSLNIPGTTSNFNSVSLQYTVLNLQGNNTINNLSTDSLTLNSGIPLFIDVNLRDATADSIISDNIIGTGRFAILDSDYLNIYGDRPGTTTFNITSAPVYVNENVEFAGSVYMYDIAPASGGFSLTQTRLNSTVLALPVAANSKVVANVNTVNSLYNRIDVMLSREYLEYQQERGGLRNNPYVQMLEQEINNINKEYSKDEWQKMAWFIPNAGYQKVNFGNDVQEVKNTFYGGLAGVDYPYWISDTSAFIPTVFMGYLGAKQKYQGATLNDNSLAIGGMLTYMKDFAVLSAQAYIANGTERYSFRRSGGDFDVFSLTASVKGELNMHISDNVVMQPAFTAIYNLSNLQNYTTTNYARIESTRFHNFLLTPSVKFMISSYGWYPYVGISYNFNEKQRGEVSANEYVLDKYKLKNFGEISVGMENTFLKYYSGYAQVSAYLGSSKGVAFQMGLRGYWE